MDSEAAQQGLPQSVLLDPLVGVDGSLSEGQGQH